MIASFVISSNDFTSELDSETIKHIAELQDSALNDKSYMYIIIFFCVIFLILSYLLYFKADFVYKISESWKSYTLDECTDEYRFLCKVSAILSLLIAIYLILFLIFGNDANVLELFS